MYNEPIERILAKLQALKQEDETYEIFGAEGHLYELDEVWNPEEVLRFEQKWNVKLPEEYRAFLMLAGSGGAGPYYGLERPEEGVYTDLDYKSELNDVSGCFSYTEAWNAETDWDDERLSEEEQEALENDYFGPDKSAGLLRISNFGCGVSINLVVNGPSYGQIWIDDRVNQGGIYPDHYFDNTERLTFLTWYETWLDRSLDEIRT
ncbi:SMI1/KNR4 family protein [Paenibacillus methanolicus]|uniref:SMI1/KNR4 family protein SUKH-1 n=1 Tax=Paenibacillus methanolicus TaxID=582686 RepID=A0A5S5BXU7_9BACL|nr:SMI1/KNR4 family protein [Paenibacillus methanolicus]TYP71981.1 SMI1/KNR4 family protein SUKH-1 [Paenibacillus methanolicus]